MRAAVGLLAVPALGVWILLLLGLGLVLSRLIIMSGRLLVLVVAHRFCSIILVASIVFAMLDGYLSKAHSVLDSGKMLTMTKEATRWDKGRRNWNYDNT